MRRRRAPRWSALARRLAWTRCRPPPVSCASSIRTWPSTCGLRCRSRARIRARSRSSRSAARARCMRQRWRAASVYRPCWCRSIPVSIARSACCRRAYAIPTCGRKSARLQRIAADRVNELFAALEAQAMQEAVEEGFSQSQARSRACSICATRTRAIHFASPVPAPFDEAARMTVKHAFDSLHQKVYGQSAPNENADIVTFRLQSEIAVPRLSLPELPRSDGNAARAIKGQRPLYDTAQQKFDQVNVWDRGKLARRRSVRGPSRHRAIRFDHRRCSPARRSASTPHGTLVIEERAGA